MPTTRIRQGQIYWLDNCEPLDGDVEKTRPVVVIGTPEQIRAGAAIVVVACTTHPRRADTRQFKIVDRTLDRDTGLPRACWALPRWYLLVNPHRLNTPAGNCPLGVLVPLITAVLAQIELDQGH